MKTGVAENKFPLASNIFTVAVYLLLGNLNSCGKTEAEMSPY
jgi:hypothetical protein